MNHAPVWSFSGLLLAAACCSGAEPALTRYSFMEPHMGTRFKVVLYAQDEATAQRAARAAFQRIAELDRIMSDYHPTSELMQLCQKAGTGPVHVSADLFLVLSRAQEVSRLSDGAFDVTVGPVVRLWRRSRRTQQMPDPEQLAHARALVGYQKVRLDGRARTVALDSPGMLLDLGGIAKGFAADAGLVAMRQQGITRALVAAGGDIAVSEAPPGTGGWTVGIAPLDDPDSTPSRYLLLENAAVSTSGDAEQYVEINGKRYSHIVDPHTGIGLVGRSSVTVVARHGLITDPLTKVVSVLGPQQGLKIIDMIEGVGALVVRKNGDKLETFISERFPEVKVRHPGEKENQQPGKEDKKP